MDQWNRIKGPEVNSCASGKLVYDEARIYNGEETVSSISGAGKTRQVKE